jgi:hypothetical protein
METKRPQKQLRRAHQALKTALEAKARRTNHGMAACTADLRNVMEDLRDKAQALQRDAHERADARAEETGRTLHEMHARIRNASPFD